MGNGEDCVCAAHSEGECGCGADWTSSEVYELRARIAELEKELKRVTDERDLIQSQSNYIN